MAFSVTTFFPDTIRVAECAYCQDLLGIMAGDILEFTNVNCPQSVKGFICPQCDKLNMIIEEEENNLGQIDEVEFL